MSLLEFEIDPPILTPWLTELQKRRNILLLDFQIDKNENNEFRFDLDIAFNPISIRRNNVTIRDFYIGCMGAEISIKMTSGNLLNFTEGCSLDVSYTNQMDLKRTTSLSLIPELNFKNGNREIKTKLGSIVHNKSKQQTFLASFSSEERLLAPVKLGNTIKWVITLPRGEKVIRDFLIGNLYLYANYNNFDEEVSGQLSAHPSDVTFFDSEKRVLNLRRSILMRYLLYKRDFDVSNTDGVKINFKKII